MNVVIKNAIIPKFSGPINLATRKPETKVRRDLKPCAKKVNPPLTNIESLLNDF